MTTTRKRAVLYGFLGGGVLGLTSLVLLGGRFAMGSVVSTPVMEGSARATTDFAVSSGGLYLAVVVIGILGGMAIAGIAYGVGRAADAAALRFPLRYMVITAGLVAAVTAYTLLRAGIGAFGDITAGVVTVPVLAMTLIVAAAGALSGALTADIVDRLSHPEVLGLEGVAWPTSGATVVREMGNSVGLPVVALVVALAVAVPVSQLLLAAEGLLAVAIFSLIGALVLGGAALAAYRPWERNEDRTTA